MSIKRKFRLRLQRDFDNIFRNSRSISHPEITLRYRPNQMSVGRLAVVASRKVAKRAVGRNLLRRRLKEIIRPYLPELIGWDIVFLNRPGITKKSFAELKEIVLSLLKRAKLILC